MRQHIPLLLAVALMVAACGGSGNDSKVPAQSASTNSVTVNPTPHEPGAEDIRAKAGKIWVTPNFRYFRACGHPCDLGVYSTPNPSPGAPLLTNRFPLEGGYGEPGDWVEVICKVPEGKLVSNDQGAASTIWVRLRIPAERLRASAKGAKAFYAPDMWTGNTGLVGVRDC